MLRSSLKSVFRRNQISAARRGLKGGGNFDCATGIRVDTVINRTDKTLSASKTVLSHISGHNSTFDSE